MKAALLIVAATLAGSGAAWGQPVASPNPESSALSISPTPAAPAAVAILQDVCLPLLRGGDLKAVAKRAGLSRKDGDWVLPVSGKRQIQLDPPDHMNPTVCSATIIHRIGGQAALLEAIGNWAASQTPPLQPVKVQEQEHGVTYLRTTSTWSNQTATGAEGLVFTAEKTLQGQPVGGDVDQSELMISLTPSLTKGAA